MFVSGGQMGAQDQRSDPSVRRSICGLLFPRCAHPAPQCLPQSQVTASTAVLFIVTGQRQGSTQNHHYWCCKLIKWPILHMTKGSVFTFHPYIDFINNNSVASAWCTHLTSSTFSRLFHLLYSHEDLAVAMAAFVSTLLMLVSSTPHVTASVCVCVCVC